MNPKVQLVTSAFGVDQQWQINNLIGLEPDRWQSEERLIRARKLVIQWRMLVTRLKDQQEKKGSIDGVEVGRQEESTTK